MANNEATVFGGSGFVGRYVVRRLAAAGMRVRVAVRRPDEALFLKTAGAVGQVVPVAANIRDEGSVAAAVAGAGLVVNLVGILHESGRQTFASVLAAGAGRIARLAKAAGTARLVHVSAIGADPASPSAYARGKAEGERLVREAFPRATILRPSIVVGPEDDFFNRFARLARFSPVLPLIGGGHTRFQPVYVEDVAAAVMAARQQGESEGRIYELGGPAVYSFRDLMRLLLKEIGRRRLLLPIPFPLAAALGAVLQYLPGAPLTLDQVRLLRRDNVVSPSAASFATLGLRPTAIETVLPTYLAFYRRRAARTRS